MSDITQTLGFDAGPALAALQQLDTVLKTFEGSLLSTATALGSFKTASAGIAARFKSITSQAASAAAAVASFNAASSQLNSSGSPSTPPQIAGLLTAINQAQTGLAALATSVNNVATNLNKINPGTVQATQKAASKLVVTFGTLFRVIQTQLIVRALSTLRNGLEDSIGEAIKFETQLAQIQTIGGPTAGSIDRIASQVRQLSEEFAQPVGDVAQGFYDILSNQIGNAADSALVLREALLLSKVAVSSTADAANALSSIINSYNLNASDAADISGKLFAAVDVGRFVLSDIANTIGRVTTLAANMGVSLDEVLASLATLTINGVKADEAMTLLSNAMRGLLKPTKAMKGAFAELNVSSAEVGVATFGFQGFLEKLRETTNGTASEITQLTENIRVGRGVFGLTGKAAEQFQKNLEAIRKSGSENAKQKAQIIIETNAQQVLRDFTEIKNLFLIDFGQKALPVIHELFESFTGGKQGVIAASDALLKFLSDLAKANKIATEFWGPLLAGAAKWVNILTFGVIPGLNRFNEILNGTGDIIGRTKRDMNEDLLLFTKVENEKANVLLAAEKKKQEGRQQTIDAAISAELKLAADVDGIYKQDVANAVIAQKTILDRLKGQLKERLSLIGKVINELAQKQQDAQKIVAGNKQESAQLQLSAEEHFLDRRIKFLGDEQKAIVEVARARELEAHAAAAANAADFKGADALLQKADQRANAALDLADAKLKDAKTEQEQQAAVNGVLAAENEVKRVLEQRLTLREQENQLALAQADAAAKEIVLRRQQLKEAKTLIDAIGKFQVIAKDNTKSFADRDAAKKAIDPIAKELENVLSRGDVNIEQFLGIQDFTKKIRADLESGLDGKPVRVSLAFDQAVDAIFKPLEHHKVEITALITQLEVASGAKFSAVTGAKEIKDALVAQKNALSEALNKLSSLPSQQSNQRIAARTAGDLANNLFTAPGIDKNLVNDLVDVRSETEKLLQGEGNTLSVLINHFQTAADEINKKALLLTGAEDKAARADLGKTATTLLELSQTLIDLQAKQLSIKALQESAPKVDQQLSTVANQGASAEGNRLILEQKQKTALEQANALNAATAGVGVAAQTGAQQASQPLNALKDQLDNTRRSALELKRALETLNAPDAVPAADEEFDMRGGLIRAFKRGGIASRYFARGGQARGTDFINAKLSPGETVVDAHNSRKFFSQLQAIRAGHAPTEHSSANITHNNTTVGDIIVQGAGQPAKVGRAVMDAIKREQRRKTR